MKEQVYLDNITKTYLFKLNLFLIISESNELRVLSLRMTPLLTRGGNPTIVEVSRGLGSSAHISS